MAYQEISKPSQPSYSGISKPSTLVSPMIDNVSDTIDSISDTIDDLLREFGTTISRPSVPSYTQINKPTL